MRVRPFFIFNLMLIGFCSTLPRECFAGQKEKVSRDCADQLSTKIVYVDLRVADGYSITDLDLILKSLKKLKLNPDKILLRAFDGSRLKNLLSDGTDRKPESQTTFAYNVKEVVENEKDGDQPSIFAIAYENRVPAIAVLDSSKMVHLTEWQYRYANPDDKNLR